MKRTHYFLGLWMAALLCFGVATPAGSADTAQDRIRAEIERKKASTAPKAEESAPPATATEPDGDQATEEPASSESDAAPAESPAPAEPSAPVSESPKGAGSEGELADPAKMADGSSAAPTFSPPSDSIPLDLKTELGSELTELGARNIFEDERFRKMLGTEHPFIYDAINVQDPMVFPPVRNDAIKNELWFKHDALIKESGLELRSPDKKEFDKAKVQQAIDTLNSIKTITRDRRFDTQVNRRVAELSVVLDRKPEGLPKPDAEPEEGPCELPSVFKDNVVAIVATEVEPICLIGDYMLKPGDAVPDYPEVVVIRIVPGEVTFEVTCGTKKETKSVSINPTQEVGFFGGKTLDPSKMKGRNARSSVPREPRPRQARPR